METLITLSNYVLYILPGLILIAVFFITVKPNPNLRIIAYIFTFVLLRDALTPLGLWRLGSNGVYLWIRLSEDPLFLILFGVFSLIIVSTLYFFDQENRNHLVWFHGNKWMGVVVGVVGCMMVILPFLIIYQGIDMSLRGGPVSATLILPILIFAMFGNLLEEGLFRGYVLGFLKTRNKPMIAGLNSGLIFAFCHIFLALTVTSIGLPLLLFTLWEGVIAGLVGTKYGIIPATLTHGGAIFFLSSGLF